MAGPFLAGSVCVYVLLISPEEGTLWTYWCRGSLIWVAHCGVVIFNKVYSLVGG